MMLSGVSASGLAPGLGDSPEEIARQNLYIQSSCQCSLEPPKSIDNEKKYLYLASHIEP